MKKLLFGIFAHPDDEAFGPSAYLYRQAHDDVDVHLIVATDGESGRNEGYDDLAAHRLKEWHESGKRIGVKTNFALHYPDGGLCNNLYLEIADKILKHINHVFETYNDTLIVNFITFEERGITGHIDHITMSLITTYIFEKLGSKKHKNIHINDLLYYTLPIDMSPHCNADWIYMPPGKTHDEIDLTHNFKDISDIKIHIMNAHKSQKADMNDVILAHKDSDELSGDTCMTDHFSRHQHI